MEIPKSGPEPDDGFEEADELEETAAQARQLGAGDDEAFKQLFDTYFDRLYRYVFRYLRSAEESQDVVHDEYWVGGDAGRHVETERRSWE
ncbi:MAG: hypothetical protein H0T68_02465 [Gemmatimonadales bacterium]|nr:hypothetical protein [Gemmatimonadales bacterium]